MARTIDEIFDSLLAAKAAQPTLAALDSTSRTAIWRLWLYITAVATWTLETLFDKHKAEVQDLVARLKPHTLKWYAGKATAYQHGQNLPPDSDVYNNTGVADDVIAAAKVVAYAAVVEAERGLRIKVARLVGADLGPLTQLQLDGFDAYMRRVKDAGVKLLITSQVADGLKLALEVYYNPLVLDGNGQRLDGTNNTPVQSAVANYLKRLPFNGVFVLAYLVDVLQAVDGVVIPHVAAASAQYGLLPYGSFGVEYQPDSGYLRLLASNDLTITWVPKAPI